MPYLLDTNVCIALLNKKAADSSLILRFKSLAPHDFYLCSIVKAELIFGARKSQHVHDNLKLLEAFFAPFESLAFDDRAASFYGVIRTALTKEGNLIGANDLLIASICLAQDLVLVTRNRDEFMRVPGLRMEAW